MDGDGVDPPARTFSSTSHHNHGVRVVLDGIKLIRLDPATGLRSISDITVRSLAQRFTASGAVEAPLVFRYGDLYDPFVSFDLCCQGANSTYRIMVGRSSSITGPVRSSVADGPCCRSRPAKRGMDWTDHLTSWPPCQLAT